MKNRLLIPLAALSLVGSVVVTATAASAGTKAHRPITAGAGRHAAGKPAVQVRPADAGTTGAAHAVSPKIQASLQAVAASPSRATAARSGVPMAKDGRIAVTVTGSRAAAAAASVGGQVGSSAGGQTDVRITPAALSALAAQAGVTQVARTNFALPQAATSEGVNSAGAGQWQAAAPALGNGGAGVNIAIVDAGFGSLSAEIAAGNLPADKIVYNKALPADPNTPVDDDPDNMDHCLYTDTSYDPEADQNSDHGTGVAEIVHQMAPNAVLYLYCVQSATQFVQAAGQIAANINVAPNSGKLKVATSSLAFLGESRGDGSGGPGTTEGAVQAARRAGVLWIQSAGNYAQDHWTGSLNAARTTDDYLDLDTGDGVGNNIADATTLNSGGKGDVVVTWDQWPVAKTRVELKVLEWTYGQDPETDDPFRTYADADFNTSTLRLVPNSSPVLDVSVENDSTDPNDLYHTYYVYLQVLDATGAVRYDINYTRDLYPNYLAFAYPSQGASGSVTTPATSPYALAVGAAYVGQTSANPDTDPALVGKNQLEPFSSRGPTIDGRVKPDLLGYDGVSTNLADLESPQYDTAGNPVASTNGFYGTSAAAPHVAGAAALVAAANPNMDASQLEAFLESPTASTSDATSAAINPPTNSDGHGLLQLGPAVQSRVVPVTSTRYHGLSAPVRIAYTVSGLGVPKGTMTAGEQLSVPVPSSVPATATSVVISLSGVNAQAGTYLSLYPNLNQWPGNSTLNLGSTDRNATVTAVVGLNASHKFVLRNAAGKTDALVNLLGYFDTPTNGGDGYASVAQTRVLDTRSGIGAPKRQLAPNDRVTVDASKAGVPAGADVALINMTAINQNRPGYLTAFPDVGFAIGTVDYGAYQRSNMALVPIVNGKFTIQNRNATADAIVDVSGYFSSSATAQYVSLPAPVRVVNTATGTGGRLGAMSAVSTISVDGGGLNQVPYDAKALWAGLTAVATADGYISVYPNGGAMPHTSDVGYTKGRAVPNSSIPNLSAPTDTTLPGFSTVVRAGSIQLYEDLYGYFYTPPSS